MVEISVIIPVFNVENFLKECLDSVCNQSFKDIEIICINDGSSDNSLEILREYEKKDGRMKVIDQSNRGLGASRNRGLDIACGNYIYFLDSDDYIDLDTLNKLYCSAKSNDSDVVLFKFQSFDDNHNVHYRGIEFKIDEIFGEINYSNFVFNYMDVKRHVLNSAFSACLKLYKKEFLDSFDDFYFPENLSFEDVIFHVKIMVRALKISFVDENLYYYRSNENSLLNSSANGLDIFEVIDMVEEFLKENDYYSALENEFIFFKIAQILVYMISTGSEEYFTRAKQNFKNLQIKNEKTLKKYAIEGYNLVLRSNSFSEYLISYYELKISNLKKSNKRLSKENEKLKLINKEILSSKSWKVTKPLRVIKNFKK